MWQLLVFCNLPITMKESKYFRQSKQVHAFIRETVSRYYLKYKFFLLSRIRIHKELNQLWIIIWKMASLAQKPND